MSKGSFFLFFLLLAYCPLVFAVDVGLVMNQAAKYSGTANENDFDYTGILIPRVTGLLGDYSGYYFSVGMNYESDPWGFVPELLRAELYWRSGAGEFRMGRMQYSDPLGLIAQGFFDGARFSFFNTIGTFSAGAWYTGLLYKRRADIEMTANDLALNDTALDYNDFANSYFAPRRVFAALDWEHQGFGAGGSALANLALLGQFDLTGEDLHSQYLTGKLTVPAGIFVFELGGCIELLEVSGDFEFACAAELGLIWMSPVHRLALQGRYSSASFLPLSNVVQGYVLEPKLSGISAISIDHTARLHRTISLGLSSFYFIQSDPEVDGHFLGGEFYGRLFWSPLSDVTINFGGGAFLPSLGNAMPDAKSLWRLNINLIMLLY